jgi:hypothetical protein
MRPPIGTKRVQVKCAPGTFSTCRTCRRSYFILCSLPLRRGDEVLEILMPDAPDLWRQFEPVQAPLYMPGADRCRAHAELPRHFLHGEQIELLLAVLWFTHQIVLP